MGNLLDFKIGDIICIEGERVRCLIGELLGIQTTPYKDKIHEIVNVNKHISQHYSDKPYYCYYSATYNLVEPYTVRYATTEEQAWLKTCISKGYYVKPTNKDVVKMVEIIESIILEKKVQTLTIYG